VKKSAKNISSGKSENSPYHHSSSDLHGGNISSEKMLSVCKALGPASGFYTDEAPNDTPLTVELFAQVRSNGRILDNIRHVLGGSIMLEGRFKIKQINKCRKMGGLVERRVANCNEIDGWLRKETKSGEL
jgi:hypothetical protein